MANTYFNFTQPVVPGTRIVSARYNQDLSSIAAAFDVLPDSDSLFLSLLGYGMSTGTVPNVYNVTIPVGAPLVGYVTGMQVTFLADKTSTGAAQLNVNGLGNKLIVSSGSIGLPAGSIIAGSYYSLRYDGTNFQMQTALYALFDQAAQQAAASAAAALVSQNAAATSATNAANSASAAAGSRTAAGVSETNAATYASQAMAYRDAAQTAAATATTQATNASGSASSAATSESNALAYRNTAQTAASNASGSASAANTSAINAAASAQAAANSAASITLPLPIASGGTAATTVAAARTNLGLGNSATRNVGTAAGTVAAGDDSRIVGAYQSTGGNISGPVTMGATLGVTGTTTLGGLANMSSAVTMGATLQVQGTTTLNGLLNCASRVTISAPLQAQGTATLNGLVNVNGLATLTQGMNVTGTFNANNAVNVSGLTTLNGNTLANGSTTVKTFTVNNLVTASGETNNVITYIGADPSFNVSTGYQLVPEQYHAYRINQAGNSYVFRSNGQAYAVAWNNTSDERLKADRTVIEDAMDKVRQLTGYLYTKDGAKSTGLVAQEVQKVLPEIVSNMGPYRLKTDTNGMKAGDMLTDTLALSYGEIAGLLVQALKELDARLMAQENKS